MKKWFVRLFVIAVLVFEARCENTPCEAVFASDSSYCNPKDYPLNATKTELSLQGDSVMVSMVSGQIPPGVTYSECSDLEIMLVQFRSNNQVIGITSGQDSSIVSAKRPYSIDLVFTKGQLAKFSPASGRIRVFCNGKYSWVDVSLK